jgi:hypothetical protein
MMTSGITEVSKKECSRSSLKVTSLCWMYVHTLSRDLACLVYLLPPSILSVCNILLDFECLVVILVSGDSESPV